ncbi:MAG: M23 family metallopeptidase [Myxococcales bacterium]|nr:M23 family metallopeptidase [Myxococcales bacterium]
MRECLRRAAVHAARVAGWGAASGLAFVLVTAVVAAHWRGSLARSVLTLMVLVVAPLALLALPSLRRRRGVATAWSVVVVVAIVATSGRTVGGAVRRHGDWFLGQRSDTRAAAMRGAIAGTGALFEWFAAPAELRSHTLAPALAPRFYGPWRDGETPYTPEPVRVRWLHPLAEAQRNLPAFESRRFGAVRPQPRPWECELGHCGVDLAAPMGEAVYAVAEGIVERVERNAAAGARAGRYVRIAHLEGSVVTRYLHLDTIRKELRAGRRVAAGELLGTVGRSGVVDDFPHLHFGLSLRAPNGSERYVDPEPFLRAWELPSQSPRAAGLPPSMIALR